MKERIRLSKPAGNILKFGLIPVAAVFLYAVYYVWDAVNNSVPILSDVSLIFEHACMSLLLVVGAALLLDIHIKDEKRKK